MDKIRIVTAASLFDGHDVSINILRRILQSLGAEVIHLGHNRSVKEVAKAALEENAHAVAISSYQGGHMEYFNYLRQTLNNLNLSHVKIFGGGGGVISPLEIIELESKGVEKIYSPKDGQLLGLEGIGKDLLDRCRKVIFPTFEKYDAKNKNQLSLGISAIENGSSFKNNEKEKKSKTIPVLGITGTGGAGKSSLIDELLLRFLRVDPQFKVFIVSIDPTRKNTGGALLGDRIRMGQLSHESFFLRSLATRESQNEISNHLSSILDFIQTSDYQLIIIETSGIGQSSDAIVQLADVNLYVMTPEYGASSQLEKIEMLHGAHVVAINKYERSHGEDALRDVRKQYQRNHQLFSKKVEEMPVFGTSANEFNNGGIHQLFLKLIELCSLTRVLKDSHKILDTTNHAISLIPHHRISYLSEISQSIRKYKKEVNEKSQLLSQYTSLNQSIELTQTTDLKVLEKLKELKEKIGERVFKRLEEFKLETKLRNEKEYSYKIGHKTFQASIQFNTLSLENIPRVTTISTDMSDAHQYKFSQLENYPGNFPYTAGVFPYKKLDEEVKRQFAGFGGPKQTNARFHYLTKNDKGNARLSVAFDSVTLYGEDPEERMDNFGKIGQAGVSIATLDDMVDLFANFDLLSPKTSVSMTINGPAPILLAMYMNAAMKQELKGDEYFDIEKRIKVMQSVRGTTQADILKEDQAQNTCIFSLPFALKMMADVQEYFCKNNINRYYSVSISGYHIAEAGANPITQLAFTLSNGFTYLEYYLARGLPIDQVCSNLSYFFSNGLDLEYSVIGRVARRIWALALSQVSYYKSNSQSQKLKYHIQTSGRSLHAQEMTFNDIRTTLQAFLAFSDSCNSLHTNAFDEAITTPTTQSVRQAMAIQKIILNEFGFNQVENPLQGSFMIEELTNRVEEAVLDEFEKISKRGGVLGAMEYMYQRNKIQDESYLYESMKDSGQLPIIGVNTFLDEANDAKESNMNELIRCEDAEKREQILRLNRFKERNTTYVELYSKRLKDVVLKGGNIFEELLLSVNYLSLGQITKILYDLGGQYRRNI